MAHRIVKVQSSFSFEFSIAFSTREVLFTGMRFGVMDRCSFRFEFFAALVTRKISLLGMHHLMPSYTRLETELHLALVTMEGFLRRVRVFVLFQML